MDYISGYQEMLRRTAPGNIQQIDRLVDALSRAGQGTPKAIINRSGLDALYKNMPTIQDAIKSNKVLDAVKPVAKNIYNFSKAGSIAPLYMLGKSILNPEGTLGYQIGKSIADSLFNRSNNINEVEQQQAIDNTPPQPSNIPARSSISQLNRYSGSNNAGDSIADYIINNTGSYQQPVNTQTTIPVYQPSMSSPIVNTSLDITQAQPNDIANALLSQQGELLKEIQKQRAGALQEYRRKLPFANLSDTFIKAGLAGWSKALNNPKLADAYTGNEYSKRLEKNLEVDTAEANQLADRINKMNELGGALSVAENIGVAPETALANKDLLKILVDAEKNKLNYNRYIYKANMDVEIANKRNELLRYGYDINSATKLAVADVMARANMYGADTRLLGNYGMFGMDVPQGVVDYMSTGTLPNMGGIQNSPVTPSTVTPATLKGAQEVIKREYNR